jgi:nicotinate-nucleotide adenylyltransferase
MEMLAGSNLAELGLFCGTFNPIHLGHLRIAEYAYGQLGLNKIVFVCSGQPPHRKHDLLDKEIRQRLAEAAISGNPHFETSRVELDRLGPSYTIDTLLWFKQQYGDATSLNFIIGEDNLEKLHEWREFKKIVELTRLVVAPRTLDRAPDEIEPLGNFKKLFCEKYDVALNMVVLDCPKTDISSSEIRRRLKAGISIKYMVPPQVEEILLSEKCYV